MLINRHRQFTSLCVAALSIALVWPGDRAVADGHQPASTDATIVFFYYEDIEAAATFYEDVLGLESTMNEDWVKIYRITPTSSVGLVVNGRGYHPVATDKPAMLSIVTDDVDAWYRLLLDAKVPIQSELPAADAESKPDKAPVRGFVAEDPGGYTVEFFSWQNQD